jgi:2-amino-4-hydroxy-6-hydroxymethyldihydropteridine diphosphokinase
MRVPGVGGPRMVVAAALAGLAGEGLVLEAIAPVVDTAPLGPAPRRYANCAALVGAGLAPEAMLALLQRIERAFGRRRRGARWRARPLDLDIVLWSGGAWRTAKLTIPHPAFRQRPFVLAPAAAVAPRWRDPATGLTLAQLAARLTRHRPLPRCRRGRALSSVGRATDF